MAASSRTTALDALVASAESLPQADITTDAELYSRLNVLKKALTLNSQLRLRHAGEPARFLQSELSLHEAIRALAPVAVNSQLYPSLVAQGALPILKSLLQHVNEDIVYRVISFLHDLAAVDDGSDVERDSTRAFYDALLKAGIHEMLSDVLNDVLFPHITGTTSDDTTPAQEATAQVFAIFENSIDVRPDLTEAIAVGSKIVQTCIKHVNIPQPNDAAVELLAVFLQSSTKCKDHFVQNDGLNVVLEALVPFRTHKKQSSSSGDKRNTNSGADEEEMVENMFGLLCSALFDNPPAKVEFERLEGVELMISFMKTSSAYRGSAAKVCDFACTGHSTATQRLFMCGGIGVVFAILMTLGKDRFIGGTRKRTRALEDDTRNVTEHIFSILFHLFKYASTTDRRRLLVKLRENRAEKTVKIVSLYRHFALAVEKVSGEQGRYLAVADKDAAAISERESGDDEMLVKKLDAGLLIVQMGAAIVAHVVAYGDESLRKATAFMLERVGLTIAVMCETLQEYAETIGDAARGKERPEALNEQKRILHLVENIRNSV
ncbi:unnamed protein product [Chondrus crispus]|uniref:Beta-catenin-like protein 1 N-terminal domain-containing protein n=1 Tax=Chondrus crispus TaxID=2769 RepID=R7QBA7_CHOCR|nr:unnamed protein product [Chondrus crispus]CDF35354.1 unnamed protein product [Chondrus crispus]|eukprot:XP_005715173.1 unnamed protein product [Chondrus crispus]